MNPPAPRVERQQPLLQHSSLMNTPAAQQRRWTRLILRGGVPFQRNRIEHRVIACGERNFDPSAPWHDRDLHWPLGDRNIQGVHAEESSRQDGISARNPIHTVKS